MKQFSFLPIFIVFFLSLKAQEKDDVNTPLHLLPANYPTPYRSPDRALIKGTLDKVFNYLNHSTPPVLINKITGQVVISKADITPDVILQKGTFRITSYEWGVVFSALINAFKQTGDSAYLQYVRDRHEFIAQWSPVFRELLKKGTLSLKDDFPLRQPVAPHALDDGGAVAASIIDRFKFGPDREDPPPPATIRGVLFDVATNVPPPPPPALVPCLPC